MTVEHFDELVTRFRRFGSVFWAPATASEIETQDDYLHRQRCLSLVSLSSLLCSEPFRVTPN